jgi:hypothetical protein
MHDVKLLTDACGQLLGETVHRATAGLGTGSAVTINVMGSDRGGVSDLSQSIFIENASWRLDNSTEVLCSSKSSNLPDEEMVLGLTRLVGEKFLSFKLDQVSFDLVLSFSGDLRLSIFADCMSDEDDGDNYSIFTLSDIYTVRPRGLLAREAKGAG